jgi:hypothetical protein
MRDLLSSCVTYLTMLFFSLYCISQFFRAQAEAKRIERDKMLKKMSAEQRAAFLAEEDEVGSLILNAEQRVHPLYHFALIHF